MGADEKEKGESQCYLTTKRSGYPNIQEMLSQRASSSSSRLLLSLSLFLGLGSAQNILHRFRFSLFFAAVAPTSTSLKLLLSYWPLNLLPSNELTS